MSVSLRFRAFVAGWIGFAADACGLTEGWTVVYNL